ncbi:hypothetical protein NGM37_50585 [Streptomyces sp. TRM76130]|nr:hypothetical protein [Streptomyces sp. TRM76130]
MAGRGVHVAHGALGASVGSGRPNSEPDVIADDFYWKAHVERDAPEILHHPEDFQSQLSDRLRTD